MSYKNEDLGKLIKLAKAAYPHRHELEAQKELVKLFHEMHARITALATSISEETEHINSMTRTATHLESDVLNNQFTEDDWEKAFKQLKKKKNELEDMLKTEEKLV